MNGRNPGRRGGRGGRGYRSNNASKDFKSTAKKKKTLEDYYFYLGSAKQASNYESAADFIFNHIKKEYDRGRDIAESLRELEIPDTDLWMPTLRASSDTDPLVQALENKQYEMEYKA
jgi:hypothetical protein